MSCMHISFIIKVIVVVATVLMHSDVYAACGPSGINLDMHITLKIYTTPQF